MFKDRHLCFGLVVSLLVILLGVLLIPIASVGWSLVVVGAVVATIAMMSYRSTGGEATAPTLALIFTDSYANQQAKGSYKNAA